MNIWVTQIVNTKDHTMESILRGIVSSEHSPTLKKQLLQKLFAGWNRSETSHNDCIELFKLFIEWILVSDKSDLRKLGNYCLVKSLFSISVRNNANCLEFLTKESFWRSKFIWTSEVWRIYVFSNISGHEQLIQLANLKKETFRDFLKPPVIIGFFNNSVNTNKVEIAPLIGEILDILKSDVHEDDELLR